MSNLTIEKFWLRRLAALQRTSASLVKGWLFEEAGLPTFREAPLHIDAELCAEDDEQTSSILLVSAPGAVGKSTLARQIAFASNAVYIDLAQTDPVGGNTLSGGILKSSLYDIWKAEKTAVLIDGLDEARFRVTQAAFEAFLSDVAEMARGRNVPTVLFGRTGAVQDAWLVFAANDMTPTVIEIGFYGAEAAVDFAMAQVRTVKENAQHEDVERAAVSLLLDKLRSQTENDGDRFAGYAPVLRAVAERVGRVGNPAALIAEINRGEKPVTLKTVISAILERERGKLTQLQFVDPRLRDTLYSEDEQLDRLVSRVYGLPVPGLPPMGAADAQTYSNALNTWLPEHPFLDGAMAASSSVFDAVITTHALKAEHSADLAVQRELRREAGANPFLAEFYVPAPQTEKPLRLPPAHVGILYGSLRARLTLGDSASLTISAPEGAKDEEALRAEVEIALARRDATNPRVLQFESEQTGVLRLGSHVEDVEIEAPHATVEIGPGPEAVLVAPISIQCDALAFTSDKVIAEVIAGRPENAVYLEARSFSAPQISAVPTVREKVNLSVSWPNAAAHPWTAFSTFPQAVADPRVEEALRRFRKFVISFRSHSKGSLARFRDKLDHDRMTKGTGQAVLNKLIADGIITPTGPMYFLNPDLLGKLAGASYASVMSREFSKEAIKYVTEAIG
ncbi:hypothetical protein RA307_02510 [Xanthobacteraceae bacterium Astr-EGSB]|uniref:hypothetical protein n=1 Tax=Astrobacterium formosum TaxID=3069710 RepID=UPI0027B16DCF|nr:hypothetical protein [Xanthobacteraceae bacterium Astr-EGSB]